MFQNEFIFQQIPAAVAATDSAADSQPMKICRSDFEIAGDECWACGAKTRPASADKLRI